MSNRYIGRAEEGFISFLLVAMTLLVFIEVVMRFVFNAGYLWVQELTLHINGWFVLFGASYGVKVGAHIGVDAITRLLTPAVRRLVTIGAVLLCLVYCFLFAYGAWVYLDKIYMIGLGMEDVRIPVSIAKHIPLWIADPLKLAVEELHSGLEAGLDAHYLEAPQFPLWIFHSILFIGFILLGYRFVELLMALIKGEATGFHLADEAKEALENFEHEEEAKSHKTEEPKP